MKRLLDLSVSCFLLVALSPLILVLAALVKFGDRGPIFYSQERIGWRGRTFRIWKFRSMRLDSDKMGLSITKSGDSRITVIGKLLRTTKLDELPQLINVFMGEMSMVGPRPEVAKYVSMYTPDQRKVLELKPGITDVASIEFRNEEQLLASVTDAEAFYVSHCIPKKIELNLRYAATATVFSDVVILGKTFFAILAH